MRIGLLPLAMVLLLAGSLAGCAAWSPPRDQSVAPRYAGAEAHLLFVERLMDSDAAELAAIGDELKAVDEARRPSADQRLRRALWLARPGHDGHDPDAAYRRLAELAADGGGLKPATRVLVAMELQRLDRVDGLAAVDELRAQNAELRAKLEALTSMEGELERDLGQGNEDP